MLTLVVTQLRQVLDIKPDQHVVLERYSDSAGGYISLNETNPQAFKTLIRAAKAKLKLRLKATVAPINVPVPADYPKESKKQDKKAAAVVRTSQDISDFVYGDSCFCQTPSRDSLAFDQRSVGSGIFQFREARASQQTLVNDEAPVPQPFTADRSSFIDNMAAPSAQPKPSLAFRPRGSMVPVPHALPNTHVMPTAPCRTAAWSVYCNECDKAMANEHYHCSICDDGDFDLCQECVSAGKLCPGDGHWLIKRFIRDGQVINSTTERVSPRKVKSIPSLIKTEPEPEKEMPGAFTDETKTLAEALAEDAMKATRTCNSCVIVLPEREFVTCTSCDDFDLCIKCHTVDAHGHHPAHGFKPATEDTVLPLAAETKLAPGRNVRHNAICDGCDKKIYGVRHKCLNCPDWDYCNDCVKDARHTHPRHRFAALYQPIADQGPSMVRHFGIYCDGPLCSNKTDQSYIQGARYKCTICHDTDFCASCEALPNNYHNRTHPLIKLKTPVRNVNVSTENEDLRGNVRVMGDRRQASASPSLQNVATETAPVQQANAATQVQTVAEFTPTEVKREEVQPVKTEPAAVPATLLNAHFVRDTIPDGMVVQPENRFTQIWTMKNPGPHAWPAGCSVRYVGGDNMLNVDNAHPVAVTTIADATESNVVGREVQPGEEVAFKLVLKAPAREGKAISYWRVKSADGTPFGHRLWCDIDVKKAEQPQEEPTQAQIQQQQLLLQRMRLQQVQLARQAEQQKEREQQARQRAMMQQHFMRQYARQEPQEQSPAMSSAQAPQPPAYDMNLVHRLAQQKQRREQMAAQLTAQRQQLAHHSTRLDPEQTLYPAAPYVNKFDNMGDKERREALKQRVAHIKANILRTREEREKLAEQLSKQKAAADKKESDDSEKVKKIVEEVAKQTDAEKESEEALEGSAMVFPKLDKESPASSTYQSATSSSGKGKAAYVENEEGEVERSATPTSGHAPVPVPMSPTEVDDDFIDIDDELEVLSANGDESSDDGFLTDEEYDILDASDSETVASKN